METFTIIINDAPYTTEKAWNALRFARKALDSHIAVNIFLLADSVYVARRGQKPAEGQPNLEELLEEVLEKGATVKVCTTCVESRPYEPSGVYQSCFIGKKEGGLTLRDLVGGAEMGTMQDLVNWSREADQVISF